MSPLTDAMVAFANARLDEEQAAAVAATPGPWYATGEDILSGTDDPHWTGACAANASGADAAHIVLHEPSRTLRDIGHKRAILAEHAPVEGFDGELCDSTVCGTCGETSFIDGEFGGESYPCTTVRRLVARWDDHPDYEEAWKP